MGKLKKGKPKKSLTKQRLGKGFLQRRGRKKNCGQRPYEEVPRGHQNSRNQKTRSSFSRRRDGNHTRGNASRKDSSKNGKSGPTVRLSKNWAHREESHRSLLASEQFSIVKTTKGESPKPQKASKTKRRGEVRKKKKARCFSGGRGNLHQQLERGGRDSTWGEPRKEKT